MSTLASRAVGDGARLPGNFVALVESGQWQEALRSSPSVEATVEEGVGEHTGATPLLVALAVGAYPLFRNLIHFRADVNHANRVTGVTPLNAALEYVGAGKSKKKRFKFVAHILERALLAAPAEVLKQAAETDTRMLKANMGSDEAIKYMALPLVIAGVKENALMRGKGLWRRALAGLVTQAAVEEWHRAVKDVVSEAMRREYPASVVAAEEAGDGQSGCLRDVDMAMSGMTTGDFLKWLAKEQTWANVIGYVAMFIKAYNFAAAKGVLKWAEEHANEVDGELEKPALTKALVWLAEQEFVSAEHGRFAKPIAGSLIRLGAKISGSRGQASVVYVAAKSGQNPIFDAILEHVRKQSKLAGLGATTAWKRLRDLMSEKFDGKNVLQVAKAAGNPAVCTTVEHIFEEAGKCREESGASVDGSKIVAADVVRLFNKLVKTASVRFAGLRATVGFGRRDGAIPVLTSASNRDTKWGLKARLDAIVLPALRALSCGLTDDDTEVLEAHVTALYYVVNFAVGTGPNLDPLVHRPSFGRTAQCVLMLINEHNLHLNSLEPLVGKCQEALLASSGVVALPSVTF
ncbi:uncharacterized protein AMSG_08664 [Thecamonas trahens ATCC 50062]|uniref:Uncharacterized protein n=1 Tax=Thecamonas trahens ATCC 50062 TaxID=461836 RepID=A0A0L0DMY6_THETB|nr:hypothetical protein AMSG_08664 [Thecamonas trahens ATCC 50062]KNC52778.1 hypothetical protein AMSG_08664 [Thecamonas trahens ATCC 50062]|eukprot:XP_013755090.1 hypothetical protein AMSG_08664 [Thecamonas trahens ATCC 50062]